MLVEEIMNKDVVSLPPTAKIMDALQLLQKYRIRHIPIVNKDKNVVGIVSDRDVRDASPSILTKDPNKNVLSQEIQSIMSKPVTTVHPLDFVEEIARIFYEKEFAAVPVVQNNKLVGIVTEKHILYTLIQLTGTHVQGSHIEIKIENKPGEIPKVTSLFAKRNLNIISLLIYPYKNNDDYKILVLRFATMNPQAIIQDIKENGYKILSPNHLPEKSYEV